MMYVFMLHGRQAFILFESWFFAGCGFHFAFLVTRTVTHLAHAQCVHSAHILIFYGRYFGRSSRSSASPNRCRFSSFQNQNRANTQRAPHYNNRYDSSVTVTLAMFMRTIHVSSLSSCH